MLDDLERWLHATFAILSRKSDTAEAILYVLELWLASSRTSTMTASKSTARPPSIRCTASAGPAQLPVCQRR